MSRTSVIRKILRFVRSPYWPALLSGIIAPGIGQISNRDYGRGILLLVIFMGSLTYFSRRLTDQLNLILPGTPEQWAEDQEALKAALVQLVNQYPGLFVSFNLLILTVWVFGIWDAYISAKQKSFRADKK